MSDETRSMCENCQFYNWGDCRRFPPAYVPKVEDFIFPRVTFRNWCGEYQRKQAVAQSSEHTNTRSGDET